MVLSVVCRSFWWKILNKSEKFFASQTDFNSNLSIKAVKIKKARQKVFLAAASCSSGSFSLPRYSTLFRAVLIFLLKKLSIIVYYQSIIKHKRDKERDKKRKMRRLLFYHHHIFRLLLFFFGGLLLR